MDTSVADQQQHLSSILSTLPATIPPTSRINFLRNWWQRSDHTSSIAEARLLHRIPLYAAQLPLIGRAVRVPLDDRSADLGEKGARLVNTLHLRASDKEDFKLDTQADMKTFTQGIQRGGTQNLVLCHGYGAGLGFFYRNFQALGQIPDSQLFAIDWLGMGRSSRPKWTINPKRNQTWDEVIDEVEEHFVESLEDWRKRIGLETMTLMGHSLGGYFATCYALKYPKRVEKLVLISPAGIAKAPPEQQEPAADQNATPQQVIDKDAAELNAKLQAGAETLDDAATKTDDDSDSEPPQPRRKLPAWAKYLWDKNVTPMSIVRTVGPFGASLVNSYTSRRFAHLDTPERYDLYDYIYNITASTGSGEYALAAVLKPGAFARRPLFDRLAQLKMPTVFVYGEWDWMDYKAAEQAKVHMKVPVKILRVKYGGHHMYLDNPDQFNEMMTKELGQ
ncbi:Alpha/Beta hydrolase protein [Zychaea mexicana]|uniref:Alpha/Beta hydrolase protein n=1 Tax=Zychaea mexicana TaxID=64656 RepID=UPI0022FF3556|nr:Alpha/Beta hydrolase protein [Zychaea mexicana]KAI9490194.1 Alpha/Beta hydrolase protein [Zychaea mexicana]